MLGSMVSSSSPKDFQPNWHMAEPSCPFMAFQANCGPPGKGYIPVGMKSALDSSMGLPNRFISAFWMLGLAMPLEVSKSFICIAKIKKR